MSRLRSSASQLLIIIGTVFAVIFAAAPADAHYWPSRPAYRPPVYNRPSPVYNRPSPPVYNRPSPVYNRPSPPVYNRPSPVYNRPSPPVYNRPSSASYGRPSPSRGGSGLPGAHPFVAPHEPISPRPTLGQRLVSLADRQQKIAPQLALRQREARSALYNFALGSPSPERVHDHPALLQRAGSLVERAHDEQTLYHGQRAMIRGVWFRTFEHELPAADAASAEKALKEVMDAIRRNPDSKVVVFGLASVERGTHDINANLAELRAQTIKDTVIALAKKENIGDVKVLGASFYQFQRAGVRLRPEDLTKRFGQGVFPEVPAGAEDLAAQANQCALIIVIPPSSTLEANLSTPKSPRARRG